MDFLDRASLSPADGTLVQSQAILFAAALFIGCTLFDVQSTNVPIGKLLPFSAAGTATAAKPAPAPARPVQVRAEPQRPFAKAASPYRVALQRTAQACNRAAGTSPAPMHAWRKTQPALTLPAASVLALVD